MSRLKQLQKLLETSPDDIEVRYMLAMEFKAEGDARLALQHLDECLERHPDYLPAFLQKAHLLIAEKRIPEARQSLEEGIAQAKAAGNQHAASQMQEILSHLSAS